MMFDYHVPEFDILAVKSEISFGPKVPNFSAEDALIFLAQYISSDFAFAVRLLARFNSTP